MDASDEVQIVVRVPASVRETLKAQAGARGVAPLIRSLIDKWLEGDDGKHRVRGQVGAARAVVRGGPSGTGGGRGDSGDAGRAGGGRVGDAAADSGDEPPGHVGRAGAVNPDDCEHLKSRRSRGQCMACFTYLDKP